MKVMPFERILLAHGSGGKLMHELIRGLLLKKFNNPILKELADSAIFKSGGRLAFTTDSFVVNPLFFPGGDIGKLAVCGVINDLVMSGAHPEYLSLGLIVEEGLEYITLARVVDSLCLSASRSQVSFITGDFKVVEKGACDKMFINISGIGRIIKDRELSVRRIRPQDKIIITGNIAQHGLAVLTKRKDLDLGFNIKSDCAALDKLLLPVMKKTGAIKFMRDPTRGGVATTLNEITGSSGLSIIIDEKKVPLSGKARAAAELLGIDPLYIANEGIAILVVDPKSCGEILSLLRRRPLGRNAREVGSVIKAPNPQVILNTVLGTQRILDMLTDEPLPRIC